MKYLFILLLVCSCSVNYHLNKAIKKGYRCDTITDTIRVVKVDSFLVVKHDTTYWEKIITSKDTIIKLKVSYIPKTRYEIRFDYKSSALPIELIQRNKVYSQVQGGSRTYYQPQ